MLLELLPKELSPETIIHMGWWLLLVVVFFETGIVFGFFLPGDSLLFTAGIMCGGPYLPFTPMELIPMLITTATLGTAAGFFFGQWTNDFFSHRKENFFYRKKYIDLTQEYFQKYGMMAFVLGRFIPIVRTFLPILAGIAKIDAKKFWIYNLLGATLWVTSVVMAGYILKSLIPGLDSYIGLIALIMIFISTLPLAIQFFKKQLTTSNQEKAE